MKKKLIIGIVVVSLVLILASTSTALIWALIKDFLTAVAELLFEISDRWTAAKIIGSWVFNPLNRAVGDLPELIKLNPNIMTLQTGGNKFVGNMPVENVVNFMITMTIPFYVFGIVSTAFYLLFISGSPMGRARAKAGLLRLIISVPLIFLTIPIIQLAIDISEMLTINILGVVNHDSGILMLKESIRFIYQNFLSWVKWSYWPAFRHPANAIMLGMPVFLLIFMRYYFIIMYTIMFPLTVFLYAFRFSRHLGETLFKQTFLWIFSQVMMAIVMVGISVAAYALPVPDDPMFIGCFGLGGFLALAVSPAITLAIANWSEMIGMMRDLMYTPWISLATGTLGMGIESIGREEVSPPPPIEMPRIPPKT